MLGFSCNPKHDTWRNIREKGEFVANLVGEDFGPLMHILEQDFPYEVSEIEKANLTEMRSDKIIKRLRRHGYPEGTVKRVISYYSRPDSLRKAP